MRIESIDLLGQLSIQVLLGKPQVGTSKPTGCKYPACEVSDRRGVLGCWTAGHPSLEDLRTKFSFTRASGSSTLIRLYDRTWHTASSGPK